MELFKDTCFDFLGKKWWFILPSLILSLAGLASLIVKGGPRYSVDFRGGAVMTLRWEGAPPIERLRAVLSSRLGDTAVVASHDLSGADEILISTPIHDEGDLGPLRQVVEQALATISTNYSIRSFEVIGPQIGADLRRQALMATSGAPVGVLTYLAWRFRIGYGAAAVLAMVHDTFITVGLFSLLNQEISLAVVAALLTLIGYSMNDTIVVFDRIRENRRAVSGKTLAKLINQSVNQTLSRTVLTSGLTLLTAISLFIFGGQVLRGFSLALVIGIIAGTFSSIFIASPILFAWEEWRLGRSPAHITASTGGVR